MATANTSEVELYDPGDHEYLITTEVGEVVVGLVGETGSGKTSFINALLRNKTGVPVPTSKPQSYNHPGNPNIELWDLPGLGTKMYADAATYYKQLDLANAYDAFLLFTKARLTTATRRLAKRLECTKKPFLFVRTFIDEDAKNEKYAKEENFNKEKMKKEIKKNICEGLTITEKDIFLISNVSPDDWDFSSLVNAILLKLPTPKKSEGCTPRILARQKLAVTWQSMTEKCEDLNFSDGKLHQYMKKQRYEIAKTIKKSGIVEAMKQMEEKVDGWKKVEISLAVIGKSGAGKSSFINTIRGVKAEEPEAAKVNVVDTTMDPQCYPFKDNSKITLWDLPGYGTPKYAANVNIFCSKVDIKKYNGFIILDCGRFSTDSKTLADKLKTIDKPFFFARTKIDLEILNQKHDYPSTFDETATLEKIKKDCFKMLNEECAETPKVEMEDIFLISNHMPHKWDFGCLATAIKNRLSTLEQECFLYSMSNMSEEILKEKVKFLKVRAKFVSFFRSTFVKFFTWRKHWEPRNNEIISKEVKFYQSKLGFPLKESEITKMPIERQEEIQKFYLKPKPNTEDVKSWLQKFDPGESDESKTEDQPWWDDIDSYRFVSRSLHHLLDEMEKVGEKILKDAAAQLQAQFDDMNIG